MAVKRDLGGADSKRVCMGKGHSGCRPATCRWTWIPTAAMARRVSGCPAARRGRHHHFIHFVPGEILLDLCAQALSTAPGGTPGTDAPSHMMGHHVVHYWRNVHSTAQEEAMAAGLVPGVPWPSFTSLRAFDPAGAFQRPGADTYAFKRCVERVTESGASLHCRGCGSGSGQKRKRKNGRKSKSHPPVRWERRSWMRFLLILVLGCYVATIYLLKWPWPLATITSLHLERISQLRVGANCQGYND